MDWLARVGEQESWFGHDQDPWARSPACRLEASLADLRELVPVRLVLLWRFLSLKRDPRYIVSIMLTERLLGFVCYPEATSLGYFRKNLKEGAIGAISDIPISVVFGSPAGVRESWTQTQGHVDAQNYITNMSTSCGCIWVLFSSLAEERGLAPKSMTNGQQESVVSSRTSCLKVLGMLSHAFTMSSLCTTRSPRTTINDNY